MIRFFEYIDRTDDEVSRRLELVKKALERGGFRTKDFIKKDQDPHVFVYGTPQSSTFEGVRFYLLGDILAFKVQKKVDTEPYGKAYTFALQDMYDDMVLKYADNKDKKKSIKATITKMADELREFFNKSKDAVIYTFSISSKPDLTPRLSSISLNGQPILEK